MDNAPTPHILLPSLLAGPTVVILFVATQWSAEFTDPIALPIEALPAALLFVLITSVIGLVPALIANWIGSVTMLKIGNWFPLLRFPLTWPLAGGFAPWGVVHWIGFGPDWTFAYTGAGAICACLCRIRLD